MVCAEVFLDTEAAPLGEDYTVQRFLQDYVVPSAAQAPTVCVELDASLVDVLRAMETHRQRQVFVVDREAQVIGM